MFYTLYMIFKIIGLGKDIRDVRNDPAGFMAEKLLSVVQGVFLVWKIVLLLPFIPLIIFGFTNEWGGPFVWVRIVTFVWGGVTVIAFVIMGMVVRVLRRKTRSVADAVITSAQSVFTDSSHE